jgi:protein-disulfide isomerase
VAEVNGEPITSAELEARAERRLARLRQEEYDIRREALEALIEERLVKAEAARRGLSPEALEQDVDAKVAPPPLAEAERLYESNAGRFPGRNREEVVSQIRDAILESRQREERELWVDELRREARVTVRLEPPRIDVPVPAGAPAIGTPRAPVTIVEFTDYQCPYCHRAQGVMDQILTRYAGKVRLVHRDFPLEGHEEAIPAARAAHCAGEQGRFWEYHNSLMTVRGPLDEADLRRRATGLKLDPSAFLACVASRRHDDAIRTGLEEGVELGVTGTPAYFINGRLITGARPLSDFAELIDDELDRQRARD